MFTQLLNYMILNKWPRGARADPPTFIKANFYDSDHRVTVCWFLNGLAQSLNSKESLHNESQIAKQTYALFQAIHLKMSESPEHIYHDLWSKALQGIHRILAFFAKSEDAFLRKSVLEHVLIPIAYAGANPDTFAMDDPLSVGDLASVVTGAFITEVLSCDIPTKIWEDDDMIHHFLFGSEATLVQPRITANAAEVDNGHTLGSIRSEEDGIFSASSVGGISTSQTRSM